MADYGKIEIKGYYSANADYSNPKAKFDATTTFTPVTFVNGQIIASGSVGADNTSVYTITPEMLADVSNIVIKNTDATIPVLVKWASKIYDIANPGGSGYNMVASSKKIVDASSGGAFANVSIGELLYTTNAEDSTNRGSHTVVTKTDNNTITVNNTLADDTGDTTITFEHAVTNQQKVNAGGMLNIPGNMLIRSADIASSTWRQELQFQAIGGHAVMEVLIFGS
mgnify:FL=1